MNRQYMLNTNISHIDPLFFFFNEIQTIYLMCPGLPGFVHFDFLIFLPVSLPPTHMHSSLWWAITSCVQYLQVAKLCKHKFMIFFVCQNLILRAQYLHYRSLWGRECLIRSILIPRIWIRVSSQGVLEVILRNSLLFSFIQKKFYLFGSRLFHNMNWSNSRWLRHLCQKHISDPN